MILIVVKEILKLFIYATPLHVNTSLSPLLVRSKDDVPYYDPVKYGFGISKLSGQYKVVRILHEAIHDGGVLGSHDRIVKTRCMAYTLGSGSWRNIEVNEDDVYNDSDAGAFLNGNLHWLFGDSNGFQQISCFDLETELFKPFPPPFPSRCHLRATLTIVGDCLCFCNYIVDTGEIDIWEMKEYGVQESWTRLYAVSHAVEVCDGPYGSIDFAC